MTYKILTSILVICLGSGLGVLGAFAVHEPVPASQEQTLGGGDSTVNTLPQVKATTTPFLAITSTVHGRDLYFPFSRATTSALAVRSLNASNCDLKADTSGNFYCGTDASGSGGSGNVSTSSAETQFRIPFWDSTSATPALLNGGDANLTFNPTTDTLSLTNGTTTASTTITGYGLPSIIEAGTTYYAKAALRSDDPNVGAALIMERNATNCPLLGCGIWAYRSRGDRNTKSIVSANDYIFALYTGAYDGTDYAPAAAIRTEVDGTPGADDMPGRIVFETSPDGTQTLTERFRISNNGSFSFDGNITNLTSSEINVLDSGIALGTETSGNYVRTAAGTANQITVTGSGAEDADITLSIPTDFRVSSTTISGNLLAGNATTSSLGVLNLTASNCDVKSTTAGVLFCGTDATAAGSADPFTFVSYFGQTMAATSSGLRLTGSPISIAASGTAQFSNSTTTLATIGTAWLTNLFIGVDTIAEYIADTAGAMFTGNTETDITVTYDDTDNTVDFVVDTLPNLTGTLDIDSGGTGTTTTAAGYAAYWGSSALLGTPTTTASCSTGASCTSFTIFGSSPISISTTLGTDITAAEIANGDHGDFTYSGGSATIDANAVALGTDTTGDYTAGISSSGSITVGNGTGEGASATVNLNMGNANSWAALQSFLLASTTLLSNTGTAYFGGTATSTFDSTGSLTLPAAATFSGAGLTDCDTAATSKLLWDATSKLFSCGTDQTGAGGGSWPFTPTTHFGTSTQATSTPLFLRGNLFSLFASSTSVFDNASTSQMTISSLLYPATNDGASLGNASFQWSDIFLASGSVINLNNGDVTLTHSANTLTLGGGSFTFSGNDPDVTTGTNEHFNISPNGTGRVGISSTTPMSLLGVAGTTTTQTLNIDMPTHSGTSTQYIYSNTAAFGGEVILEDMDGAGCTSITTLNGVIYGNVVTCPTAPVAN